MAYFVGKTNSDSGNSATFTPTLHPHQTGDLLLVALSQDGGGTTISTSSSGWAMIGTQAASGFSRMAFAYKVAASGSETNPTFSGDTEQWVGTAMTIRDNHATPFGSLVSGTDFIRTDWSAAWTADTGSLTTGADDALLIYGCCTDTDNNSNYDIRVPPKVLTQLTDYIETTSGAIRHVVGYVQAGAAGAAPTVRFYFNDISGDPTTQQGGNTWVIAVRNKASGVLQPCAKGGVDPLCYYGDFRQALNSPTWQSPSNFVATIGGVSTSAVINSATLAADLVNPPGYYSYVYSTENTADKWVGGTHTIPSTDMSGKVFYLQWQIGSRSLVASDGWCVGFSDGTNWVVYQLSPSSNTIPIDTPLYNQIALGSATALYSSGSINWAAVTRIAYIWRRNGSSGSQREFYMKSAMLMGTASLVGGGSGQASKFSLLPAAMTAAYMQEAAALQGSGQTLAKASVQIGDGSTKTYFDLSAQSIEFPQAYDATDATKRKWNATANAVSAGIYPSASDTILATAGIMATSVQMPLTVNASASTSASLSTAGSSFVGWAPTWKTGIACDAATFKQCGTIDFKGADITNVIANEGTGTALMSASDGFSATGCTLTASATAVYGIRIAAAGTFSLDSTTFSGFTKDIDVTATTGTVTINLADGQATPTYQTAGATVNIVSNPVYQTVTISGAASGSRIQIYDTTSSTELYNGTPTFPHTWTDSAVASATRDIRLRVSKVSGATAKVFIEANIGTCATSGAGKDVSYLVNQVDDTVYNNNAIDGSGVTGVTFTDSGTDVINIDVAAATISWKSIYAAWVYYANTSGGIATDIDYIDAVDEANYILSNLLLKNTSSPTVPLQVTGGFGRDSVTGLTVTLAGTSGGTLIFAPDHVVSYAVGSGVTSQDKTDIAAEVLSQASSTPIHADVRKVVGITVDGAGTEADPWGPA